MYIVDLVGRNCRSSSNILRSCDGIKNERRDDVAVLKANSTSQVASKRAMAPERRADSNLDPLCFSHDCLALIVLFLESYHSCCLFKNIKAWPNIMELKICVANERRRVVLWFLVSAVGG